jgi:predicted dehydrogenase
MTGPTVRIGLVGYGMGGRYFHAPLIAGAAGCELAGVVTRSTERRAELARDSPGVTACDTLADLAATGVDAVVVSTPLHTHLPLVREAVGLGLPVVCDKPFAAAVRGRAPVPVDPWDAVAALAVLDPARTSATQGRVVELNG